jgi:hypothetical protein
MPSPVGPLLLSTYMLAALAYASLRPHFPTHPPGLLGHRVAHSCLLCVSLCSSHPRERGVCCRPSTLSMLHVILYPFLLVNAKLQVETDGIRVLRNPPGERRASPFTFPWPFRLLSIVPRHRSLLPAVQVGAPRPVAPARPRAAHVCCLSRCAPAPMHEDASPRSLLPAVQVRDRPAFCDPPAHPGCAQLSAVCVSVLLTSP